MVKMFGKIRARREAGKLYQRLVEATGKGSVEKVSAYLDGIGQLGEQYGIDVSVYLDQGDELLGRAHAMAYNTYVNATFDRCGAYKRRGKDGEPLELRDARVGVGNGIWVDAKGKIFVYIENTGHVDFIGSIGQIKAEKGEDSIQYRLYKQAQDTAIRGYDEVSLNIALGHLEKSNMPEEKKQERRSRLEKICLEEEQAYEACTG